MYRLASQKENRISGSEEYWTESGPDIERTVFFSDAVFAIAITLLVLDLRVPQIPDSLAAAELPSALLELSPKIFSFLVSFWVIGYAAHNILAGFTLSWLWRHASKDGRLVKTNPDTRATRYHNLRALFLPTVFVLSIGISFFSVEIARGSWLLAFLAGPVLQRYM